MQNIDVRFNATSNFGKVKAELAALQAQAAALGNVFAKGAYAQKPDLVDERRWSAGTRAIHEASRAYRAAASSSGLMTTQQIRATSEAERYTKALQKQKLTMQEMARHRGIMKQVYQDQLRYRRMTAQYWGTDMAGRAITDIAIPRNVPDDLRTMGTRMRFFSAMTKSAGTQMINMGKNIQWAGRQLTVGFTYPAALFGAAAGYMAFQVEDAFAKINKVYDVSAASLENEALRTKELGQLRVDSLEMAEEVARRYGITIEKTLAVEQELAATGLKGPELLSATSEVQRISALGGIDPQMTSKMIVALKTAFKDTIKDAEDLENVLNFMNATSNATSLSLQDIAEATPRAASGLSQLGVTAEEMTILLVSMTEAGVNSAEGSNALKSLTTRILNPAIVKKATDIFEEFGATIDIAGMVEEADGNLFKFVTALSAAIEKEEQLTKAQKASAVAALSGTYQFNRFNAILENLGTAQAEGNNQTARAIELQSKSAEELKSIANISEELMINNPAGRFKQAWAEFQIQLAEMGEPFLEVATVILEFFVDLAEGFNNLSPWIKKLIMIGVAVGAIAGPVIMLTGLFFNLFGQFVKGMAGVMSVLGRLAGGFGLVTKEEQASILTAKAQNDAMMKQKTTMSTLVAEMNVLTAAYQRATSAAQAFTIAATGNAAGIVPGARPGGFIGPQTQTIKGGYQLSSQEQTYFNKTPLQQYPGGPFASHAQRLEMARNAMAADYMKSMNVVARDATKIEQKTAAEARIRERMNRTVNGTGVAIGAMGIATGLMMLNINETTNSIAKWAIIGALVVPAAKALAASFAVAAKNAWAVTAAQYASARASMQATAATTAQAGRFAAMNIAARGVGAGLMAMMGPVGWIATGVVAITAGIMIWRNRQKEIYEQQVQYQDALDSSADKWAESVGKARVEWERIALASSDIAKDTKEITFDALVEAYRSGDQKGTREAFEDLGSDDEAAEEERLFIEYQKAGDSAQEAARKIAAMYTAMNRGSAEAEAVASRLLMTIGKLGEVDWARQVQGQMDRAVDAFGDNQDVFEARITNLAQFLREGLGKHMADGTIAQTKAMFNTISSEIRGRFEEIFQSLSGSQALRQFGINSAQELASVWRSQSEELLTALMDTDGMTDVMVSDLRDSLDSAKDFEETIVGIVGGLDGMDLGEIKTLDDLLSHAAVQARMMTFDQQIAQIRDMIVAMQIFNAEVGASGPNFLGIGDALIDARKDALLLDANMILAARNLGKAKNLSQALKMLMDGAADNAGDAADEAGNLKNELDGLPSSLTIGINIKDFGGVLQTAMSSVQSSMADSAMTKFNTGWDNRIAGVEAAQEAATNRLENQQEAAMQAFEDRWERRREAVERAYERRIEAINREIEAERKADDIRQQLFEKEKARLQRLAELENANIDFNTAITEGRLDDAAKIANNAQVQSANAQMDNELAAAQKRTEARIEILEKRAERLEKAREKAIERLEKMEERMRRHLERVQQARANALQQQQEDVMDSLDQQREYEEATLEQRLDLFLAYTARNKRDLERWMKELGFEYDDFGKNVMAKGESWATSMRESLLAELRAAGLEVASDNMWEKVGKDIGEKLLRGLGFKDIAEFNRFLRTGSKAEGGKSGDDSEIQHSGGVVGDGGSGRGGIPNTYAGLHRSEKMVLAQKGEYIINRRSSAKYRDVLKAINDGSDVAIGGFSGPESNRSGYGYGGPVARQMGYITKLWERGLGKAYNNIYQNAKASHAKAFKVGDHPGQGVSGGYVPGGGGTHRPISGPVTNGLHGGTTAGNPPAVDMAGAVGRPVYAVASGVITQSRDIAGPLPTDSYKGDGPYGSFGRMIQMRTNSGAHILYAHLDRRSVRAGQSVKGGAILGYSGNTGNSSGPHLHFGATNGPYAWLRRGGKIRYDNTSVMAHRGETMLSARLTKKFEDNIGGGGDTFSVTIDLRGAMIKEDVDIKRAVNEAIDERENKRGRKRKID